MRKVCNADMPIPLDPNNDNVIASTNNTLTRIIVNIEDKEYNFSLLQDFRYNRIIGRIVYKTDIGYPHSFVEGKEQIDEFFELTPKLKQEFIYKL